MSKMSTFYAQIELMLTQGYHPTWIAAHMECPLYVVKEVAEAMQNEVSQS